MLSKKLPVILAALAASVAVAAAPAQARVEAPTDAHSDQIIAVLIGLAVAPRPFTRRSVRTRARSSTGR